MSDLKQTSSSQASQDKLDIEGHNETHIPDLNIHATSASDKELKDAEVKEAHNAAFAAAVSTGSTDPLSKAAFIIYACMTLY